jgi:2-succinyl-5-enolpyruvyl-6-hydroxy-3-cyclohexene-1-carboxylate synthase
MIGSPSSLSELPVVSPRALRADPGSPDPPASVSGGGAAANLHAALQLLATLVGRGLRHLVVCPGSRSAPLAAAAALLEPCGLRLHTAIDERSAAFFALALGRAQGVPAALITTSGSAVAHLLPAAVEADHGAIPLLLISADRPERLKGCGANQTVNQEAFLAPSCRWCASGDPAGLAAMAPEALQRMARQAWTHCLGGMDGQEGGLAPPGAVHLNLPFAEPLHGDAAAMQAAQRCARELVGAPDPIDTPGPSSRPAACDGHDPIVAGSPGPQQEALSSSLQASSPQQAPWLDPDRPGVVVAGPWRGAAAAWPGFLDALIRWQRRTGWPVLADPLSGLRGCRELICVVGYDLLLEQPRSELACGQILRLGPLPASRRLERWLVAMAGSQLLVCEGEPRPLDPLRIAVAQESRGLETWFGVQPALKEGEPSPASLALRRAWQQAEDRLQRRLGQVLALPAPAVLPADHSLITGERPEGASGPLAEAPVPPGVEARCTAWSEPLLARSLSLLLPEGLPLMLANSSPVRDWECFADPGGLLRPVFGFRGASGIDGTLSEACGLAEALGACVLVSGDLALLHDSNGWLWRSQLRGRLTVVLIDNGGGGIFEQLPIRLDGQAAAAPPLDFERLFAMPQAVDPLALAAAHGVPGRRVKAPADLPQALEWALAQPFSLLVVVTDRRRDAELRCRLRTMAAQDSASG